MIVIPVLMILFFHALGHVWGDGTSAEFVARLAGSIVLSLLTAGFNAAVNDIISELF